MSVRVEAMQTTREELLNNLHDPAWLCSFVATHLSHRLQKLEKSYHYWKSDRESEPMEQEAEYFEERGIPFWDFDHSLVAQTDSTRKVVVVFESGGLFVLRHSHTWGPVRSDFEAYADTERREAVCMPLSEEEFGAFKERIADEFLSAAKP